MNFSGFLWIFGIYLDLYGFVYMDIRGFSWIYVYLREFTWINIDLHGFPWITWIYMDLRGFVHKLVPNLPPHQFVRIKN